MGGNEWRLLKDGCHVTNDRAQPPPGWDSSRCAQPLAGGNPDIDALIQGLQEELIACQRLAALGSITAMVTHEFNNLLTPIMARAEAALMDGGDVAMMRKALERTLVQSQRALSVTRHLLDLVHDGPRPAQACSVACAVREAVATLTRPLEKDGIELRVSVPEDLQVCAREDLLCQVLLNLLLNARQAMKGIEGTLSITAVGRGDRVEIDVRDSGKGIPHDTFQHLINPFLAADPRARPNDWQQVGLGLSVCRIIAHHHGASLQGVPNDGRGCTFRLHWPAASAAGFA